MKSMIAVSILALALNVPMARAADDAKKEKEEPKASKEEKKDAKEVAVIKTTAGDMVIEFWPDVAPKTVENFKSWPTKGSTMERPFIESSKAS